MGNLLESALESCDMVNAIPGHISDGKHNDLTVRLNLFLKHKCTKSERLYFANCNPPLESRYYTKEGLHFNEEGKGVYANHLRNTITIIENLTNQPLAQLT